MCRIYRQYSKIFGQNFAIPVIVQRLVGWRWCQPPAVAFTAKKGRQGCKFCKLCRGRPILKRRRKKIPKKFGNSTLQMYMVNSWSLYRQMLYKIQTTAHKMKYTLFPVIFMVILGSSYCENPLKLWKMEYSLFL